MHVIARCEKGQRDEVRKVEVKQDKYLHPLHLNESENRIHYAVVVFFKPENTFLFSQITVRINY